MKTSLHTVGLILGPVLFICALWLLPDSMPVEARGVAATAVLMAAWWITEAIPIPATALLPIVLFPLLGVMTGAQVTLPYADHLIYLFLGGFLIGTAIEKWGLHQRIALHTIRLTGLSPARVTLGFMLATAFLSMWISNTASTIIMFTIAMAFLKRIRGQAEQMGTEVPAGFATGLMLAVAYSASIGGVATLIGTPANAVLAGVYQRTYGESISFVDWMVFGLPLAIIMLILTWLYLTRVAYAVGRWSLPVKREWLLGEIQKLGALSRGEKRVAAVALTVVTLWLVRGFTDFAIFDRVQDSTIAILGAVALFITPVNYRQREFLLDWKSASTIPWDVLILFGGGFALANGFVESGLVVWLGEHLQFLQGVHLLLLVLFIATMVIFLTEMTSNTATAAMLLPIMVSLATAVEAEPLILMATVALTSSFAFMLPVATPPNAIVFSSRVVTIRQMAKTGFWLNILGVVLVTFYAYRMAGWL